MDESVDTLPPVSQRARQVHASGMLFDGHNDLPWRLRIEGDLGLSKFDLSKRLNSGQTDIPRLREGGVKAQFWSVYIPSEHPNPARTVTEQIDLVNRMVDRYHDALEMAYTADDVERITKHGKIASLIGIEGGVAIENSLAQLRAFYTLGARYMTLTHNTTLDWADAANDAAKHDGLTPFGERVVKEMNRLGMLVDISHVSPATMADALRVSQAPLIASHSSAFAICPSPRNVPDEILKEVTKNGGVIMVNFFSGFVVPETGKIMRKVMAEMRDQVPGPSMRETRPSNEWFKTDGRQAKQRNVSRRRRSHRPSGQGRWNRSCWHRLGLRRNHHVAGWLGRCVELPTIDRRTIAQGIQRNGYSQDSGCQRASIFSPGRRSRQAVAGNHNAGSRRDQAGKTRWLTAHSVFRYSIRSILSRLGQSSPNV